MIKARFMKAYPCEDSITYTLKGEKSKDALRAAAEYQDENCVIDLAVDKVINELDEATKALFAMILDYANRRYEQGRAESNKEYLEARKTAKTGKTEDDFVAKVGASEIALFKQGITE